MKRTRFGWLIGIGLLLTSVQAGAQARTGEPQVATGARGMVVCQQPIAARVGLEVLRAGGNAVDAAVATAFTLAVVHPQAGNIGGGGFLMHYRSRDSLCTMIDFRETAPAGARRDMYLDGQGAVDTTRARYGHLSVGVPGTPAGLHLAWAKYGRQPWRSLVAPAIRLAQDGFPINSELGQDIFDERMRLTRNPAAAALFVPKGKPLKAGDRLVQKDLARALRLIAQSGPLTFYEGAVGEQIATEMEAGRGLVSRDDLARYRAIERRPLRGRYRDVEVLVPPPPSSGGVTLIEILKVLEYYDLAATMPLSTYRVHLTTEVMARAFADRNWYLGDPAFVRMPLAGLLSPQYIASQQASVRIERASAAGSIRPGDPWRWEPGGAGGPVPVGNAGRDTLRTGPPGSGGRESDHTTHLSVVDAEGNVVSLTTTLNSNFGSGVLVKGAGFLLNNEMDDFVSGPGANQFGLVGGGEANAIEPGKRMLSSMTPTIVLRGGRPWLVLGSKGGPRIITSVLNVLVDVVDHKATLEQAVARPRFHHQWQPHAISHEPNALAPDVRDNLRRMGHILVERSVWGGTQCIEIRPDGTRIGVSDPRSRGAAAGY